MEISVIFRKKRLNAILFGTDTNPYARLLLHLFFWACIFQWFVMQANWVVGNTDKAACYLVAFQKNVTIIACFYGISYLLGAKLTNLRTGLGILVVLVITFVLYGLTSYSLYHYIEAHYQTPSFFLRFVKNISTDGLWTFARNHNVIYYYIEQLGFALFIPLSIKVFRITYQANFAKLKVEKDNLLLEVDFLRSQINPHFLFNTLNSVYGLIEDKDRLAADMVHSLADMMRYSLYQASGKEVEVSQELDFITSYLAIQKIRHSKRLTITTDFSKAIYGVKVPPLLLIDFVENAFKHGADQLSTAAWINITARMTGQQEFCFQISNLKPETHSKTTQKGIGMANAQRRLDILYPGRHQFSVTETADTYNLTLKIW
ncbi:sensor histidine kinase [Pedobacter sp. UC225_61]|uniref:sensor histidine kinase n=1 Tax=Pedobacter sp. UC225_61 TaxID=3374623 RepID=UPI0037A7E241